MEHIKEIYTQYVFCKEKFIKNTKNLVYKLALKAWLPDRGNTEIQTKLKQWEDSRIECSRTCSENIGDSLMPVRLLVSIFMRLLENMVNKLVLINEDITEEQIRSEIYMIFEYGSMLAVKSAVK